MKRSYVFVCLAALCLGIAGLTGSISWGAGDKASAKLDTHVDKIRGLEKSLQKNLQDAIQDCSDLDKKCDEDIRKLMIEAAKTKDAGKKDELQSAINRAQRERRKVGDFQRHCNTLLASLNKYADWETLEDQLSAQVIPPSAVLAEQLGLAKGETMVVVAVGTGTLAAKVGLKPNDIMLRVNGQVVPSDPRAYLKLMHEMKTDPVEITVIRHGKQMALSSAGPATKKIDPNPKGDEK